MAGSEKSKCLSELDALQNVSTVPTERGLRFDRRTLHAFHTALKSSGSSPLVTLAGVSGTGKASCRAATPMPRAQLSRARRAAALGQPPRPVRLLRLSRAEVPADRADPGVAGDGPHRPRKRAGVGVSDEYANALLDGQMLLVLLDEMNLARVEYYFSEFLSKLETRAGSTGRTRGNAGEPRSCSSAGRTSAQQPLRLFVGQNVLFVGTMNEDESTQASVGQGIDGRTCSGSGALAK